MSSLAFDGIRLKSSGDNAEGRLKVSSDGLIGVLRTIRSRACASRRRMSAP